MRYSIRIQLGLLLAASLSCAVASAEPSAVYLQDDEPTQSPAPVSLLRQWTEPPPATNQAPGPVVAAVNAHSGVVSATPAPQRVASNPDVTPNGGLQGAPASLFATPDYGALAGPQNGYGGLGYGGLGYGGPYTPLEGSTVGPANQASPYDSLSTQQPYETLGSESLPAPSAAVQATPLTPATPATQYAPPVNSGAFNSLWGGYGEPAATQYNAHGYESAPSVGGGVISQDYATPQNCAPPQDYAPAQSSSYTQSLLQAYAPDAAPMYQGASYPTMGFAASPQWNYASVGTVAPQRPCVWWQSSVLAGWLNGYDTPSILTSNPAGTGLDYVGDLTSSTTRTLYGGRNFGDDVRFGGRLAGGMWFGSNRRLGIQGDAFALGNDNEDIRVRSSGDPILARPFYNTTLNGGAPDAQVLAMTNFAQGRFDASTTGRLISAGAALRFNICSCGGAPVACCDPCDPCCDPCAQPSGGGGCWGGGGGCGGGGCFLGGGGGISRVDLIAGYRYLQLREGFTARETLFPTGAGYAAGSSFTLTDNMDTQNDFHAFELGAIWQVERGRLLWDFGWSAAFGEVTQRYQTNGSTNVIVPGNLNTTVPGGFLVRPEDIRSFERSKFTVMPQARIGMGYCLTQNLRLHVDYSFLYLDNVLRPGAFMTSSFDGQTLGVEPVAGVVGSSTRIPGTESVYLHALSLGVSCNY